MSFLSISKKFCSEEKWWNQPRDCVLEDAMCGVWFWEKSWDQQMALLGSLRAWQNVMNFQFIHRIREFRGGKGYEMSFQFSTFGMRKLKTQECEITCQRQHHMFFWCGKTQNNNSIFLTSILKHLSLYRGLLLRWTKVSLSSLWPTFLSRIVLSDIPIISLMTLWVLIRGMAYRTLS